MKHKQNETNEQQRITEYQPSLLFLSNNSESDTEFTIKLDLAGTDARKITIFAC